MSINPELAFLSSSETPEISYKHDEAKSSHHDINHLDLAGVAVFCTNLCRYAIVVVAFSSAQTLTRHSNQLLILTTLSTGWYTTEAHVIYMQMNPNECNFIVNKLYSVISSSISFWIPCTIMVFTYLAIFREANRQEKQLAMRHGNAMLMHRHSNCGPSNNGELSGSGSSKTLTLHEVESEHTPTKDKHLIKMKREHKAARTLGIIMGRFNSQHHSAYTLLSKK